MFRFLLILGLALYILYKIGSFFFRAGAASQQLRDQQQQRNYNSNASGDKAKRKGTGNKGGEYIDYEEVK